MKMKITLLTLLTCYSLSSYSQTKDSTIKPVPQVKDLPLPKGAVQFTPNEMVWKSAPETLPKGTQMCVLYGDPKAAGPFVMRLKIPANQVIKLHTHPYDEVVTVLEGAVMLGFGDRMQMSRTKTFTAGSFYVNPANTKHFAAIDKDGATIQINAMGPWKMDFK
jgi:quercetin dioxygenase-like cupin family protein